MAYRLTLRSLHYLRYSQPWLLNSDHTFNVEASNHSLLTRGQKPAEYCQAVLGQKVVATKNVQPFIIPLFHGTTLKKAKQIMQDQLHPIRNTDSGYYGQGVYFTNNFATAANYAYNSSKDEASHEGEKGIPVVLLFLVSPMWLAPCLRRFPGSGEYPHRMANCVFVNEEGNVFPSFDLGKEDNRAHSYRPYTEQQLENFNFKLKFSNDFPTLWMNQEYVIPSEEMPPGVTNHRCVGGIQLKPGDPVFPKSLNQNHQANVQWLKDHPWDLDENDRPRVPSSDQQVRQTEEQLDTTL